MSSNIIQRILDATNGGLDIILQLCPDAGEAVDKKNKHFKLRNSEKTASAVINRLDNGSYYVKDFGGDFSGSAINIYCYLTGKDLKTAIKELAGRYSITDDTNVPFTPAKPIREKRSKEEGIEADAYEIATKPELTQTELETLFSRHTIDYAFANHKDDWKEFLNKVCARYNCFSVDHYWYVKEADILTVRSTPEFPIFCFVGKDFKKLYSPMAEKKYRFRTFGKQDKDYIWGYERAIKEHENAVSKWQADNSEAEPEEGKKRSYDEPKLEEIIICSGNGDSLNVAALGYNVVWQNSETAIMPEKTFNKMKDMAKAVYNLPDIDSTGLAAAHRLAMRFLDLKTIYLPMELLQKKDKRGNPCKDLRDYMNHFKRYDFVQLVNNALEYKFWTEEPQYNKNGEFKRMNYGFDNVCGYNFLMRNGFYRIASKTAKDGYEYIHINRNFVRIIKVEEVKAFVNGFLEQRFTDDRRLRNTFYRMNQLKDESLNNLKFIEPDFKYYEGSFQFLFFQNATWKVTAGSIEVFQPGEIAKMVWEEKVIKHFVKLEQAPFTITEVERIDGTKELDITINSNACLFLNYLINTSRVHWRKELETNVEEKYQNEEEQKAYREKNRFNIAGELLDKDEQHEQKQHLINKIYVLGYLLARHKEKSKPWAPFLMDHKLSAEGESHGGSGKTIFARSVEHFMNFLLIDGKSKSLIDDKHAFENVTDQTEVILIDDLGKHVNLETFFSMLTEGMTINPKYTQRFVIPYENAPKIIFTSNFGVKDITSSAERRLIYAAFSDYYHNNYTGTYREDRTPKDDFGKDLFSGFNEAEWNAFCNTMAYALQFYFSWQQKINPPMDNVLRRNLQGLMGDAFIAWSDVYFSYENNRLDTLVAKQEAYQDFIRTTNEKYIKPNGFSHKLEHWCRYNKYVYNPVSLRNGQGRIIKKWPAKKPDGSPLTEIKQLEGGGTKEVFVMKATEMIYIQTVEGIVSPDSMSHVPDAQEETTPGNDIIQGNINDKDPFE